MSFEAVKEFNTTFEVAVSETPKVRVPAAKLRFRLIKEEFGELLDAIEDCDIVEVADALGDIEYVIVGAALAFGIAGEVRGGCELIKGQFNGVDMETNPLTLLEGHTVMLDELRHYILTQDIDSVIEALATILAIVSFTADTYQIDLPAVIKAIHTSNMTKLDELGKPIFREGDRKVLKGPSYVTPTADIEAMLFGTDRADAV